MSLNPRSPHRVLQGRGYGNPARGLVAGCFLALAFWIGVAAGLLAHWFWH